MVRAYLQRLFSLIICKQYSIEKNKMIEFPQQQPPVSSKSAWRSDPWVSSSTSDEWPPPFPFSVTLCWLYPTQLKISKNSKFNISKWSQFLFLTSVVWCFEFSKPKSFRSSRGCVAYEAFLRHKIDQLYHENKIVYQKERKNRQLNKIRIAPYAFQQGIPIIVTKLVSTNFNKMDQCTERDCNYRLIRFLGTI